MIKTDTKTLFVKIPLDKHMAAHQSIFINEQTCNKQTELPPREGQLLGEGKKGNTEKQLRQQYSQIPSK